MHSHQQDVEPEDRSESCHWTIFNNMHNRLLRCTIVLVSGPLCWTNLLNGVKQGGVASPVFEPIYRLYRKTAHSLSTFV